MVVYGTRPEAIKLAPVTRAIQSSPGLSPIVTVTGQHRAIVDQVHAVFGVDPDHDLKSISPGQSLDGLTARVLQRVTLTLRSERPDAVVVQGDTTSAFAAALAAFYERIPLVHVEAGLRTGDLYSPFPEEARVRPVRAVAAPVHDRADRQRRRAGGGAEPRAGGRTSPADRVRSPRQRRSPPLFVDVLAIDVGVHRGRVEAEVRGGQGGLGQRMRQAPRRVGEVLAVDGQVPVLPVALVRAL